MMFAENNRTSRRGFTIIEMLAVLFILAIIVALIASVSIYVMNEANKKETRSCMAIIHEAVLLYTEIIGEKPSEDGGCTKLFSELKGTEQTMDKIRELPASVFQNQNPRRYFCDAWGNQMRFYRSAGRGGAPLLISAGPDGDFGTTDDNIRSDQP